MSNVQSKLVTAGRLALGAAFVVFGLNGFLGFLPQPPLPEAAGTLIGAMAGSGYLMALVKGTEVVTGALLLANRYVPLALTVLAPVIVNIVAFHAFLAPAGTLMPLGLAALAIFLAWSYRDAFRPMLQARVEPTRSESSRVPREALAG